MLRGVLACDTGSEVETGVWSGRVMAVVAAVAASSSRHTHGAGGNRGRNALMVRTENKLVTYQQLVNMSGSIYNT